ncbi:omega-amidase, chloroplastic-like isoform X3 [Amborella trichopoda]|uniref:omega-amidase, chloroplastic-like isoform X3 n=1 Tax=Amborella trichopoda TaxID=13333 RepID=UPI0009BFB776|nr:omega-amidase, chloroplastic-like isoform X3 [Amborella trichopoda]XP_020526058.1 omega-amidase, chloroplastic-like isoform X3 [Amborella trichopoda]|eukprot:XP_020526057.1 omega-amidase, chloroplastic-like isoform X3 [Amborella trichopoda]
MRTSVYVLKILILVEMHLHQHQCCQRLLVVERLQSLVVRYPSIAVVHLFDIDVPGDITFRESDTLTAGEKPTIVDTDVGRIGIGICHDIRFPELAMLYEARGAHLICYPGAFNMSTGQLLWELIQRARAADNQLFVATCSLACDVDASYVAWGHSTLVGPFGEIIAKAGYQEITLIAEIDYYLIQLRRTNLPLEKQRRGDLYKLVDLERLDTQQGPLR